MAVDTRNKRMSMIGLGSPIPRLLPNPDGSFVAADRAFLAYLYAGIALVTPSIGELIEGTVYIVQLLTGTATIVKTRAMTATITQLVTGTVER